MEMVFIYVNSLIKVWKTVDLDESSFCEVTHILRQDKLDRHVLENWCFVVYVQHVYNEWHGCR